MSEFDPHKSDPPLLKNHSQIKTIQTSRFTYTDVRIFFRKHPQLDQLPTSPALLPLIVCLHGLGGSVAQFHPLLTSLVHVSSCLAVDLPGCGRSAFVERDWKAYGIDALTEFLETVIEEYRDIDRQQPVVLIGHSLGGVLAANLANPSRPGQVTNTAKSVVGVTLLCPPLSPLPLEKQRLLRLLIRLPGWVMDLMRWWDRRGGLRSKSVLRLAGADADEELCRLQQRFNVQSKTQVWRRMAWNLVDDNSLGGANDRTTLWTSIQAPVYVIAGEADRVTPPDNVEGIIQLLQTSSVGEDITNAPINHTPAIPATAVPIDTLADADADANDNDSHDGPKNDTKSTAKTVEDAPQTIEDLSSSDFTRSKTTQPQSRPSSSSSSSSSEASCLMADGLPSAGPVTPNEDQLRTPPQPLHPVKVAKSTILPTPSNHTLLYAPASVRIVAGLVCDFLTSHVTGRLSLGWQLQYLSREGKWDVKNLAKWKAVQAVSDPIGANDNSPPVFRAMKTLREVDETHSPERFVETWKGKITDIVDISHAQPVYDPRGLERGGIRYKKFPTVSKIPPTDQEVTQFIRIIDAIREQRASTTRKPATAEDADGRQGEQPDREEQPVIGVHCHYGFNRTGFFLVCYLVERCHMTLDEAIETFARARPPGIRHSHFLDRLYLRYAKLRV